MPEPRIYVAGHRGMVGSAIVRQLRNPPTRSLGRRQPWRRARDPHPQPRRTRPHQPVGRRCLLCQGTPRPGLPGRRQSRRHSRQQQLPGRVHLPKPDDRGQHHSRRLHPRRAEAALPRLQLHLPPARAAAVGGRRIAHRHPGTDQRSLRHRQDRRHQTLRELQPPVRHRLPQRHADQPLRPRRQLRPAEQPRHSGDDPQAAPGQTRRRTRLAGDRKRRSQARRHPRRPQTPAPRHLHRAARSLSRSGAPARPGANSSTSTTWPPPACTS
jgi:hypothetical protein